MKDEVILRASDESHLVSPSSNLNVSPNPSNTVVSPQPNAQQSE